LRERFIELIVRYAIYNTALFVNLSNFFKWLLLIVVLTLSKKNWVSKKNWFSFHVSWQCMHIDIVRLKIRYALLKDIFVVLATYWITLLWEPPSTHFRAPCGFPRTIRTRIFPFGVGIRFIFRDQIAVGTAHATLVQTLFVLINMKEIFYKIQETRYNLVNDIYFISYIYFFFPIKYIE